MHDDFLEIISIAQKLDNKRKDKSINIKIFTNSIVNPLDKIIKYYLDKKNISSYIEFANFNTILPSETKERFNIGLIIWECENLFPNGYDDLEKLTLKECNDYIESFITNFEYFLKDLSSYDYLIIKKLNGINYCSNNFEHNSARYISEKINLYLMEKTNLYKNIKFFDDSDLIYDYGKDYYGRKLKDNKLPYYSTEVLLEIGNALSLMILSHFGLGKKVLILDCDKTLWNGVIGEDDNEKIFSTQDKKRDFFLYANKIFNNLKNKGVLLAICSKNNFLDVKNFFDKKSNNLINFNDLIAKKINWELKSKNILDISNELNLGTSSFVFLDDSEHEINEVKSAINDIDCILVPKELRDYKKILLKIYKIFSYSFYETGEDANRTQLYQDEEQRNRLKKNYSYEEYLKNLSLEMNFSNGNNFDLKRLVQMTQKTNQFNLTVLRQSENELKKKLSSKKYLVYAFSLKDKFGDYGTVGLCQIKIVKNDTVLIENLLMSCRVMGRNAEQSFLNEIIKTLNKQGYNKIYGLYSKGQKNQIVENFYEKNGFVKNDKDKSFKYEGKLYIFENNSVIDKLKIIKINYG
jgi:FkbH-like protein